MHSFTIVNFAWLIEVGLAGVRTRIYQGHKSLRFLNISTLNEYAKLVN